MGLFGFNAQREVDQWLASIQSQVEFELGKLIREPLPKGAAILDFELHHNPRWDEFPVVCYPMDRSAGQCGFIKFYSVSGLPATVVEAAAAKNAEDRLASSVTETLLKWFPARWLAAGGQRAGIPAYLSNHDDIESLDLNTGKMIDSEEKWSE